MNVISYCLFKTLINQNHRDWDIYRMEQDRYWYNIPLIVMANRIAYPDFLIKIYITSNIQEDNKYSFLKRLDEEGYIRLVLVDMEYNSIQPTLLRMIPYFSEVDVLLCRDIDSLPKIAEINQTRTFIDSKYIIHTIRSHRQHNSLNTKVLAGLCGFKVSECKRMGYLPYSSFEEYYTSNSSSIWGCDQNTLIRNFYINVNNKTEVFLDSPLKTDTHDVLRFNDVAYLPDMVDVSDDIVLKEIDKLSVWSGEPIDAREEMNRILSLSEDGLNILKIMLEDDNVSKFYKVSSSV